MSTHLTPLEVVERLVCPITEVGAILGIHEKSPYPWRHANKFHSAGDIPSAKHMRVLLQHAKENRKPLTATHLICGAPSAEIDALLLKARAA